MIRRVTALYMTCTSPVLVGLRLRISPSWLNMSTGSTRPGGVGGLLHDHTVTQNSFPMCQFSSDLRSTTMHWLRLLWKQSTWGMIDTVNSRQKLLMKRITILHCSAHCMQRLSLHVHTVMLDSFPTCQFSKDLWSTTMQWLRVLWKHSAWGMIDTVICRQKLLRKRVTYLHCSTHCKQGLSLLFCTHLHWVGRNPN